MASIFDKLAQFAPQQGKGNSNTNGLLESMVGAYGAFSGGNGAYEALGNSNGNINSQIQYLQDMYNPNGAVAQQYAKELAAKDAAAGRNSQYANRSALLQAKLAEGASRNASTINQLSATQTQQQLQQQQIRAQQLASLFNVAKTSGLTGWAENGLKNMFSPEQPAYNYDQNAGQNFDGYQSNNGSGQMYGPSEPSYAGPMSPEWGGGGATGTQQYPTDLSQLGWLDQQ